MGSPLPLLFPVPSPLSSWGMRPLICGEALSLSLYLSLPLPASPPPSKKRLTSSQNDRKREKGKGSPFPGRKVLLRGAHLARDIRVTPEGDEISRPHLPAPEPLYARFQGLLFRHIPLFQPPFSLSLRSGSWRSERSYARESRPLLS